MSKRGVPDFVICLSAWFVALELKTEDGRVDKLQEFKLKKIKEAEGLAFVVTPKTWPEQLQILKQLSERRD